MVLGQCMEALRSNQTRNELSKNPTVIPYRQSKLTEIFKTSFEGNGKAVEKITHMLCNETYFVLDNYCERQPV